MTSLDTIIPIPAEVIPGSGSFKLTGLTSASCQNISDTAKSYFSVMMRFFAKQLPFGDKGSLQLIHDPAIGHEAWEMNVTETVITISASGDCGFFYAAGALRQLIMAAAIDGWKNGEIACGCIKDAPRFKWRGFMLDSSRHCQDVNTVKRVIRLCADMRLNVMHLHLTDNEGWRIALDCCPVAPADDFDSGFFTKDELRDIAAFAKQNHVDIVPEFDLPAHSAALLKSYPQFSCFPGSDALEICLGNPDVMDFVKNIYREIFELFPDSKYIHMGGDEAELTHWEHCPKCRKAMQEKNCSSLRELENKFMLELTRFAVESGKTPILWATNTAEYPADTVMQAWLDYHAPKVHVKNNCDVIMSVHNYYYFDYPADMREPSEVWMFQVTPQSIYMTDPCVIWEDDWKEHLIGPEACLWTKLVPRWRIMQKIIPRIAAFAETAWSRKENKNWQSFSNRSDQLRAAGFEEFLRDDYFITTHSF